MGTGSEKIGHFWQMIRTQSRQSQGKVNGCDNRPQLAAYRTIMADILPT
jgi:hypothetical protein